jgi:hypothetical protein
MPIDLPTTTQRTIDSFDSLIAERNNAISKFNLASFKAMLVRLFIVEGLVLTKVEAPTFRELLIYLQPALRNAIPSRRSLTRYISYAYDDSILAMERALASARSKINLSFDL